MSSQVDLRDRVLVADGAGRLGWASVYLRWHDGDADMHEYVRVTTAAGATVRSSDSRFPATDLAPTLTLRHAAAAHVSCLLTAALHPAQQQPTVMLSRYRVRNAHANLSEHSLISGAALSRVCFSSDVARCATV